VLIVDLDNTLWGGIVSETAAIAVVLSEEVASTATFGAH